CAPTICRTMSAAPFATSGECDTITMPTFFPIRCSDPTLQSRFEKIAYRAHDQLRRARTRVHVSLASLAEERRPAAARHHRDRRKRGFVPRQAQARREEET